MFNHNTSTKKDRTGVGIIISPRLSKAWKEAGGLDPIHTKTGEKFEGRFIAITLKLPEYDSRCRKIKGKWQNLVIASVYHPYDDTYSAFNSELDNMLSNVPKGLDIIMGGDMNAQIGRSKTAEANAEAVGQDEDNDYDILGPFSLDTRNDKGTDLLEVYQSNNLCIMNTFFDDPTHVTWVSFNEEKTPCMLDMMAVSKSIAKRVTNCKVVEDGIRSDHSALCMMLSNCSVDHVIFLFQGVK